VTRRVIFLVGNLSTGGLERFVTRVSIEAANCSLFEPVVICLVKREGLFLEHLEQQGIRVLQAPMKWQRTIKALMKLRAVIRQEGASIVHSQVNFSLFQQWIASLFTGATFMVTERNMYPLRGIDRLRRLVQFYGLKVMGVHYSANSVEVALHLSRMLWYPERNIPVIPNGVDIPDLNAVNRNEVRARLGWQANDFVVGYVARFAAHKGHDYFVQVMRSVSNKLGARLKICFVGDGPVRRDIERAVSDAGLQEQVMFTGIVSNMSDYYAAFDCTALFSAYEGMPNVVIEAMAFGLPVVANPVGNVTELFTDQCGVINRGTTAAETATYFLQLEKEPELRRQYSRNARERIARKYSLSNTLNLLCREYGFQ
jgi:glycosyltransferase EpsF